ncbi:MAG: hypothetical protein ABSF92_05650 [Candidatus Acidiferrales bacterium]|jgi:outer membrane biosynthesis protein TonB
MKFALPTAVLLLLLGTTAPAYAQQEKGQGGHPQEAKPAQQQAKPAQQQHQQAKPAARQQTQNSKPAQQQQRQQTQNAKLAQQQHTQQATRAQQQQARPVNRAQNSKPAGGNRGGNDHGRISNDHYAASFGSGHSFHVNRGDYDHRRFQYGGYSFGFIDPWPVAWGYSDDVYVVYMDGGYYMYDRVHPGVRISINIL